MNQFTENNHMSVCLRFLITGNNYIVNNIQFLAQTDRFASEDLRILSGAVGINFVLLFYAFLTIYYLLFTI